jgi:formyl-CoA transferase
MRSTFKSKTLDEWSDELADLEICWGRVQTFSEILEDPLFREREMFLELQGKDGKKQTAIGVSAKLSETPGSVRRAADDFGESTPAILKELGYSEKEIKKFAETDVI